MRNAAILVDAGYFLKRLPSVSPSTDIKDPDSVIRLGQVWRERAWILKEEALKRLIRGEVETSELTDDDFVPGFPRPDKTR